MITVTTGAIHRRGSLSVMARNATFFFGQQNIRCLPAGQSSVTLRASDVDVLGVIKLRVQHPTVWNDRRRNHRGKGALRFDFVTIRTAVEFGPGGNIVRAEANTGHLPVTAEKHLLFEGFTGRNLRAQRTDLLFYELIKFQRIGKATLFRAVLSVLFGQTSQKRADESGVPMGNLQIGIFRVKGQRMTDLAMLREANGLTKRAGGTGFMAKGAIELGAVDGRNVSEQVTLMIESQSVRFFQVESLQTKLRMIGGKIVNDLSVTLLRMRCLKLVQAAGGQEIEDLSRQQTGLRRRGSHHGGIGMAGQAIRLINEFHRTTALMFPVAGGAGVFVAYIWLMKNVMCVAFLAGVIHDTSGLAG